MREILFRGKTVDKGEWLEGWYGEKSFGAWPLRAAITPCDDARKGYLHYEEIIPETIGQYTGLTDKNGKKIFEGDVVEQNWYDYNEPIDESFGVVVYCESNCSFSVMDANENRIVPLGSCHAYHWEVEVIGNIHDNPELLKGGASDGV